MSSDLNSSHGKQEEEEGRRVDLHTCSGETICLSFPENGTPLPKVIKLVDPDTGQSMVFQSKGNGYNEIAGQVNEVLGKLDFELCHNCRNEEANGPNELQRQGSGDERLDKQREKLQKKLKERKGSTNKDDDNCGGHCHQIIEIPIQGLSQIREDNFSLNGDEKTHEDGCLSIEQEKHKAEDLKIQKPPEVEVVNSTSVKVSWSAQVSNNGHLTDCNFELQMATKNANYTNIYSGTSREHQKDEMRPGTTYRFRVCAVKDKIKGDYSPEAQAELPSTAPDTPSIPYLSNRTKTTFLVKWNAPRDNGSPIKTYILQWDKGAGDGKYHEVYSGNQRQTKVTHKLAPGTKCVFRVQAINDIGPSEFSKDLTTHTSAGVPESPNKPVLDKAGPNYLTLSWNKPECNGAEITEYLLEMEDPSTSYGFMVAYRGVEQRWKNEKLKRNTTYKFRVSAMNSQGSSKCSEMSMFTTTPERPGRPAPPVLQGKPKITSFTVTWGKPDDDGGTTITKYVLEIDDGKGGAFKEAYSGMEYEHSMNNLSPGHTYKLRLACYSEGGCSEWSRVCKVRTSPVCPGQAKPPVMSKIYKPQPNALHVYWDPPEYNGGSVITAYMLFMEVDKAGTKEFREIYRGADNLCTVSGLHPGKAYSFCVRAANEAGVGKASDVAELSTAPGIPDAPRAPDIVCRSAAAIQITWEPPSENGSPVNGYTLEMMEDDSFAEIYTGVERSYELRKGLSPASYYYFRVKALSQAGASLYSAVGTCHTPAASPAAVSSVRVIEQSSSHLRIRWRHPANNGTPITSYNIEIAGVRNISYDLGDDDSDNEVEESHIQEYDLVDLHPNTLYRIRVQAVNKIGCGPFSPLTVGTTRDLPPQPPALELASASYQSLKLRWGNPSSKDTVGVGYTLQMMDNSSNFHTIFNGSTTSHKVGKLKERTEYEFRIQASNEAGTGPPSDVYSFRTTAQPPSAVKGLRAEAVTSNSFTVCWDSVSNVKRGDTIEYLLQSQEIGKQDDFEKIYQGTRMSYSPSNLSSGSEYRFRVCAVRQTEDQDLTTPDSPSRGLKGIFSPVLTVKTHTPHRKNRPSEASKEVDDDTDDYSDVQESKQLTDFQWAMIFFIGFTLFALGLAFIVPLLFEFSA